MVERLFKNYAQCAGLNPQYTPHCLRHSFATSLLNAGAELITIQHLLGHDHIQITQLYARLSNQKKKQAYFAAMSRLENTNFEEVEDVITG
jgi:site-specific recombinase XerD